MAALGIEPGGVSVLKTADGRIAQIPVGRAARWLGDKDTVAPVLLGPPGVDPVLGAITLQGWSVVVAMRDQRLAPVRGLLK